MTSLIGDEGDGSELFAGSRLFADLPPRCRVHLTASARSVKAGPGSIVHVAGEQIQRLVVVTTGSLDVIQITRSGHRRHVRVLGPGHHLGLVEFALGCPTRHTVIVSESATLTTIAHHVIRSTAAACPVLHDAISRALAEKVVECERQIDSLNSDDVATRLRDFLLSLPGAPGSEGRTLVRLPMQQADLASHLGTTPETLSRRLHDLIVSGAVERVTRRELLLDLPRLARG